jgi:phosphate transport system substrate-binding protein
LPKKDKLLIVLMTVIVMFSGCSVFKPANSVIRIKGSDTMLILAEQLAGEYMKTHPGISITVSGGGSATGINALIKGETDICTASRNLQPDEVKSLAEHYSAIGMEFLIAKDALSIYINPDNPVKDFTIGQLKKIFTCKITNWRDLGGINEPIKLVIRPINSGTHFYFKEHILDGEEYCSTAVVRNTTNDVLDQTAENKNAIGYGGIGYGDPKFHAKVENTAPTEENVRNDTYPIIRYLHFYTLNSPEGKIKEFIDWVLSNEGQEIVEQSGYIPLWKQ